jgi:hypothetical protein
MIDDILYGTSFSNCFVGVNNISSTTSAFTVYPNPSNTILFVEYNLINGAIPIQITDVAGQEIKNVQMNSSQIQVDISSFNNGIYFVNAKTANGTLTKKIVVQR